MKFRVIIEFRNGAFEAVVNEPSGIQAKAAAMQQARISGYHGSPVKKPIVLKGE